MTTPSVRPPAPDGELIAAWQEGWMRLLSVGPGRAAVVITHGGGPLHAADVTYGESLTETVVEWTRGGRMEFEQYRRDAWDSWIYSAIAEWRSSRR